MQAWGKIIGAVFGYLLGGFLGLLIGLWLGSRFDRNMAMQGRMFRRAPTQAEQEQIFHATFAVMGHIAKASGQVTEHEIRAAMMLMDRMRLNERQRQRAQESFRQGKESTFPLRATLSSFRSACQGQRDLLRFFLEVQLQAAFADGELHETERQILQTIADELGFSRFELERILAMAEAQMNFQRHGQWRGQGRAQSQAEQKDQLAEAYKILGVSENDSDSDIKRAYRKEMAKHHPDKLAAKGLPPEMMEMAKQKAQEIQSAWEMISNARGMR